MPCPPCFSALCVISICEVEATFPGHLFHMPISACDAHPSSSLAGQCSVHSLHAARTRTPLSSSSHSPSEVTAKSKCRRLCQIFQVVASAVAPCRLHTKGRRARGWESSRRGRRGGGLKPSKKGKMEKEEIANQFLFSESSLSFFLPSLLSLSIRRSVHNSWLCSLQTTG